MQRETSCPPVMAHIVSKHADRVDIVIRWVTCELAGAAVARVALLRAAVAALQHPPAQPRARPLRRPAPALGARLAAVAGRRNLPQPAFYSILNESHECQEMYCNQKIWHGCLHQL